MQIAAVLRLSRGSGESPFAPGISIGAAFGGGGFSASGLAAGVFWGLSGVVSGSFLHPLKRRNMHICRTIKRMVGTVHKSEATLNAAHRLDLCETER